jgi:hypothetical protein
MAFFQQDRKTCVLNTDVKTNRRQLAETVLFARNAGLCATAKDAIHKIRSKEVFFA